MRNAAHIANQVRVLLTAITLLCVVALNYRELPTFQQAVPAKAAQQVSKALADHHGVVKQKVSLEGTHAFLVLQIATLPDFPRVQIKPSLVALISPSRYFNPVAVFRQVFFLTAIQPNGP